MLLCHLCPFWDRTCYQDDEHVGQVEFVPAGVGSILHQLFQLAQAVAQAQGGHFLDRLLPEPWLAEEFLVQIRIV